MEDDEDNIDYGDEDAEDMIEIDEEQLKALLLQY